MPASHPATPERRTGPNGNTYSPCEYSVRMGVVVADILGRIIGVEIHPPIGMANTCDLQQEARRQNIGVGMVRFGGSTELIELDTHIRTLGSGENLEQPGIVLAQVIAMVIAKNEPLSSTTIDPRVFVAARSLFDDDAQIWQQNI
jgi:hypothetical protein